jgi:hypothetical protein
VDALHCTLFISCRYLQTDPDSQERKEEGHYH